MGVCMLSHVCLFVTLWTVAQQVPLTMGFSRQEYWSGLPFPSSGNLPYSGIEPGSPILQAVFTTAPSGKAYVFNITFCNFYLAWVLWIFNAFLLYQSL